MTYRQEIITGTRQLLTKLLSDLSGETVKWSKLFINLSVLYRVGWYQPWWPSGLSPHSNSSRVAAEDPGSNPDWGMYMVP